MPVPANHRERRRNTLLHPARSGARLVDGWKNVPTSRRGRITRGISGLAMGLLDTHWKASTMPTVGFGDSLPQRDTDGQMRRETSRSARLMVVDGGSVMSSSPEHRPRYSSFSIEVRESPIDGKGLYAKSRIPARRKIGELTGEVTLLARGPQAGRESDSPWSNGQMEPLSTEANMETSFATSITRVPRIPISESARACRVLLTSSDSCWRGVDVRLRGQPPRRDLPLQVRQPGVSWPAVKARSCCRWFQSCSARALPEQEVTHFP